MPKISCIMSTYNSQEYLDIAIDSILNQTFKDFEFIISDWWSTDKTKEIIKQYVRNDKRVKFIDNDKNLSNCACLQQCLKIAKWDYIAIMESDDISYPERFELELEAFDKDKDLYLVWGYWNIIDEKWDRKYDYYVCTDPDEIRKRSLFQTQFNTPWVMFKKELWSYFDNMKYPYIWDTDLYLNTIFSNKKCINITKLVIKKREIDTSLSYRKFLLLWKQYLLFKLQIIYKYKVYKENKFIAFQVIRNELKSLLYRYIIRHIINVYKICFKK